MPIVCVSDKKLTKNKKRKAQGKKKKKKKPNKQIPHLFIGLLE